MYTMYVSNFMSKLKSSKLFKDSFWAVFGNGLGNGLMLVAGILIARLLGKDVYGEYGLVKSTMFLVASFTTFGLGFSSTRYIALFKEETPEYLRSVIRDAVKITLLFSSTIAVLLFLLSPDLALYLEDEKLSVPLKYLAVIIVLRSLSMTLLGVLAGFKNFKKAAQNNLISAFSLLILSIPLCYYWNLMGALAALLISQMINAILNVKIVYRAVLKLNNQIDRNFVKELIQFSFPLALQEGSFSICNWAGVLFLTKYSSAGELGLYTASLQWNAIILMIPNLLFNVVLSHLSGIVNDEKKHDEKLKQLLLVNIICTAIPFILVYIMAGYISSFYGPTFKDMPAVLKIITFATILESCSSVLKSDFLASGMNWQFFMLRLLRDSIQLCSVFYFLAIVQCPNGAIVFSWCYVGASLVFLLSAAICHKICRIKIRK